MNRKPPLNPNPNSKRSSPIDAQWIVIFALLLNSSMGYTHFKISRRRKIKILHTPKNFSTSDGSWWWFPVSDNMDGSWWWFSDSDSYTMSSLREWTESHWLISTKGTPLTRNPSLVDWIFRVNPVKSVVNSLPCSPEFTDFQRNYVTQQNVWIEFTKQFQYHLIL